MSIVEKIWKAKKGFTSYSHEVEVIEKDILKYSSYDIKKPIGLVITSPPYPNAYEYWLYHKYRMFWLGYDPINVREHEIGARAHYFKSRPQTAEDFVNQMTKIMILLKNIVVKDGHICILIGRSKIHGEIIDNASTISKLGERQGFRIIANYSRNISASRKSFKLNHANIKQ